MSFIRYIIYLFILIFAMVFQSTFFEYIQLVDIKPNLMLITIVSFAYIRGEKEGGIIGFTGGLLQDCFFGLYVGSNTFIYSVIGYICGNICKGFYKENFFIATGIITGATLIYNFMYYVINILLRGYTDIFYFMKNIIVPEMVYNALISLLIYNLIFIFNEWLEDKENYRRKVF